MKKLRDAIPIMFFVAFAITGCGILNSDNSKIAEFEVEKEIYTIGEDISSNLINKSSNKISVLVTPCPGELQKKINGNRVSLDDNCADITNWSYYTVANNESLNVQFSSEIINSLEDNKTGTYRTGITFYAGNDFENEIFVTSKSFQIQQ